MAIEYYFNGHLSDFVLPGLPNRGDIRIDHDFSAVSHCHSAAFDHPSDLPERNIQHQLGKRVVLVGRDLDDIATVGLAKEPRIGPDAVLAARLAPQVRIDPQIARHRHLRQRHRQAPLRSSRGN